MKNKLLVVTLLTMTGNTQAYYSKQDWTEVVNVLPQHSAFLIPQVGDTKSNQRQFESVAFLDEKKVGSKRIQIPHAKLQNTGTVFDAYVPTALLVLVNRTPYVVTWSKEKTQESPSDQETCVESQDSIRMCFDVSIGANITEEDASKYLYWFGTEPITTGNAEERNFPSVLYGKELPSVLNTRVYARCKAAYFAEFSLYPFREALKHKGEILKKVEKEIIEDYAKMGITIEYLGIGSDIRLDAKLQDAIDKNIIAEYLAQTASNNLKQAEVDRFIADTEVIKSKAAPYNAVAKWNGQLPALPSTFISSDAIIDWLRSIGGNVAK
jgi:hypothetical protein